MASYTIEKRAKASGELRFRAIVRVKEEGSVVHQESKTFSKEMHARTWAKKKVHEFEQHGPQGAPKTCPTLRQLISEYVQVMDATKPLGRTKRYVLNLLSDCDIAGKRADRLAERDLVIHCRNRKEAGASPATVYHDIAYLKSVYKSARPLLGYDLTADLFLTAMPILSNLELIGRSQRRERRPTAEEVERLTEALATRQQAQQSTIPLVDMFWFSIYSCMRVGEVCAIRWDDLDESRRTVLVRNRKDPRKKVGNHVQVPLLKPAWEIVMRQPRSQERIFPCNERSVAAAFQRERNKLGIKDLRYHDLRREGASRLFEMGFSLEEVAQVTGHRELSTLWNIYRAVRPEVLHERWEELNR